MIIHLKPGNFPVPIPFGGYQPLWIDVTLVSGELLPGFGLRLPTRIYFHWDAGEVSNLAQIKAVGIEGDFVFLGETILHNLANNWGMTAEVIPTKTPGRFNLTPISYGGN